MKTILVIILILFSGVAFADETKFTPNIHAENDIYVDGSVGIGTIIPPEQLSVGNGATSAGVIAILEDTDDGANYASFTVPALGANTVYTLPPDDGDNTEVLQTNGSGVLTWVANAGGGGGVWTDLAPNLEPNDDGDGIQINDSTGNDFVVQTHDGTDYNFVGTNTTQYTFDLPLEIGGTAQSTIIEGLVVNDGGGADEDDDFLVKGDTLNLIETDAGDETLAINTSDWDISTTGVMTGIGNITSNGTILAVVYSIGDATVVETELEILDGANITTTELNVIDGNTSATGTTLADTDRCFVNDAGTTKQVALTDFETYFETALDTLSNVTTVGTIGAGVWEGTTVAFNQGGTGLSSWTQYLLPYAATTTSIGQIAIGSDGQVLTSGGVGVAPSFETLAGGGETLAETLALGADANDVAITSLAKLEGVDPQVYIDLGTQGKVILEADVSVEISSPTEITGLLTLTGGQIKFPASPSASGDANTLDDYEEGTWTPDFQGSTGSAGASNTNITSATYTKIGRKITVYFLIEWSNKGSWTGNLVLEGLPFTVPANSRGAGTLNYLFNVAITDFPMMLGVGGATYCSFFDTAQSAAVTVADCTVSVYMAGSVTYMVD